MSNRNCNKKWYISAPIVVFCILLWVLWNIIFFISSEHSLSFIEFSKWNIIPYDLSLNITVPLCKLQRNDPNAILFIKTFKTGSSTLTSIFHNYCVLHNKSCPLTKPNYISLTWDFNEPKHRNNVLTLQTWNNNSGKGDGNVFDMWINHALFHPFFYKLLPTSTKQIVSIVRNPIDRFVSGFKYYHLDRKLNLNLSTYVSQLYHNYTQYGEYESNLQPEHIGYQTNSQCRSLIRGYVEPIRLDIHNAWNSIKNGEWLLLIMERYDDSLLLLKYAYNLTFDDLAYVRHNDRKYKDLYIPNDNERELIKEMNQCDWKLYQLALKIFDYRLYEIYKGDENKKQKDLNKLLKARDMKEMLCNQLWKNKINQNNLDEYNLSGWEYKFYKTIFCHLYTKDNHLWNKWAYQYLNNQTFQNIWVNRLMTGQSVCKYCVKVYQ